MVEAEKEQEVDSPSNRDDDTVEIEELNLLNDVLLTLDSNSRKLGGCCMSLAERKLCIIEDIPIEPSFERTTKVALNHSMIIPWIICKCCLEIVVLTMGFRSSFVKVRANKSDNLF